MRAPRVAVTGGLVSGALAGLGLVLGLGLVAGVTGHDVRIAFDGRGEIAAYAAGSLACGLLFGLFAIGLSNSATVLVAPLFGYVVWIARGAPGGIAIFGYLVFGLALGLAFLLFQRPTPGGDPTCRSFAGPSGHRRLSTIGSSTSRARTSAGSRS